MSRIFNGCLKVAFLAGFLSISTRAAADEETTSVVVLPYAPLFSEAPQSVGDKSAEYVRAELEANKAFSVINSQEKKGFAGEKKGAEAEIEKAAKEIESAKELFAKGLELATSKKTKPAADAYEQGINKFLANFQGADDFKPLSDAYVKMSIQRFQLGDEDTSIALLDDLVRIDPSRVLGPPEVVPVFSRFHEKARKTAFEKERGALRITSNPAGARVMFDGRDIGETPLFAKDILPGDHFVRILKAGLGGAWKKIKIIAGEELDFNAELSGEASGPMSLIAQNLAKNTLDAKTVKAIQSIGEQNKAQFVIFGAMKKMDENFDVRSFALQTKDGALTELAGLTFDIELLGAAIEVFKLTSDFMDKSKAFAGQVPSGTITLFEGASAPRASKKVTEVSITSGSVSPKKGEGEESSGGRRVVAKQEEPTGGRRVAKPVEDDDAPVEKAVVVEEPPKKLRERCKIGDEECEARVRGDKPPVKKAVVEEDEDEPKIKKTKKTALDDALEDAENTKKPEDIDLDAPKLKKKKNMSALDPEELARLNEAEKEKSSSSVGTYLLYGGIGAVVLAGVGVGAYFLLQPSEPTSATANISWNP